MSIVHGVIVNVSHNSYRNDTPVCFSGSSGAWHAAYALPKSGHPSTGVSRRGSSAAAEYVMDCAGTGNSASGTGISKLRTGFGTDHGVAHCNISIAYIQ